MITFIICYLILCGIFLYGIDKIGRKYYFKNIAIHEAGHAIAAWWCSAAERIENLTITAKNGGGVMNYRAYNSSETDHYWCLLVIVLAGWAADNVISNKFRIAEADSDLNKAKEFAKLIQSSYKLPPWIIKTVSLPFPFQNFYSVSSNELAILQQAFEFAKFVIVKQKKLHLELVKLLMKRKTINSSEIEELLGNREMIRTSGITQSAFYFPRS